MKKQKAEPKKTGRPKKEMSTAEVEKLAAMGCTVPEIAAFFGVAESTVRLRAETDEVFSAALEKGRATAKVSLRRLQMAQAKKGNTAMLIWLGKQMLGQKDRRVDEVVEVPGPLVVYEMPEATERT